MRYNFFYECSIRAYTLLVRLAAFFLPKAKLWVEGRKEWRSRLADRMAPVREKGQQVAWFHAASLGEFEQGKPVIEAFRKEYPGYFILLSFYSPSGFEIRKDYQGADYICYLPADTASNAADFVNLARPEIAFFIKYEFWANYLEALREKGAVIILFAAVFRPGQVFFRWWGGFYRALLLKFDAIMVQNSYSCRLLEGIKGVRKVVVAGDTRFDRVALLPEDKRVLPEVERFVGQDQCLVVGSAWDRDMEVIIPVLNKQGGKLKAIIAPHEINAAEIASWQERLTMPSIRYSQYRETGFVLPRPAPACLVIDNVGMLSALYRYGTTAYIGGAFGSGLHNILEAAAYGMPLFFGNKSYAKFPEAVALVGRGVARAVGGASELDEAIEELLARPEELKRKSLESSRFVAANTGATGKVLEVVGGFLR